MKALNQQQLHSGQGRAKNFVESKKTKCRVFLPFYGFYELPMSLMMKKELGV